MTSLRIISVRPNPKPAKKRKVAKRKKKKPRARKVKHKLTRQGYLVQIGYAGGKVKYLTNKAAFTTLPKSARRFSTLKAAQDMCAFVMQRRPAGAHWVQPVPA